MPPKKDSGKPEVEDSASSASPAANQQSSENPPKKDTPKGGKNTGKPKNPNTANIGSNSNARNPTPSGFSEGNKVLESYGLSVSGRKERILSFVKTDKYFHLVEDSWNALVEVKPNITDRFSYAEFKHCAALQLYSRIEQVKFEGLGIKPSAPTRIPLPRNLRVFHPIWSALSHIGLVDDDELRAIYIPDAALPTKEDLDSDEDVKNLLNCTLYNWPESWDDVKDARNLRKSYDERIGYTVNVNTNEQPAPANSTTLIAQISEKRRQVAAVRRLSATAQVRVIDGTTYKVPRPPNGGKYSDVTDAAVLQADEQIMTLDDVKAELDALMDTARRTKADMIRPRLQENYNPAAYTLADTAIVSDPGAYGAWLHWDPQLWIDYEQVVEILNPLTMFSLSMPAEVNGTYAWLIPVESRGKVDIFCKMPKASIPPSVWIMAMIMQSSTLPDPRRSTWYVETDPLSNLVGLRLRYVRAAIKRGAATEQYGTY